MLGGLLYLPEEWLTAEQRLAARIPASVRFHEKWRQGLTLLRRARAAGLELTAVLADAEFGDVTAFRTALHRFHLPYAVGVSSHLTVFRGRPPLVQPRPRRGRGRPRTRPRVDARYTPVAVRTLATTLPTTAWRHVTWRNGSNPTRGGRFAAVRVTPAHGWHTGRLAPEVWLLCEREAGPKARIKHYFVDLPATATLRTLVRLVHQRWALEQQYQELKGELGLDHFEGRRYPGWAHHVVLPAMAHAYLQSERMRPTKGPVLTFPAIRAIVQDILTLHLFAPRPQYLKRIQELRTVQLRI